LKLTYQYPGPDDNGDEDEDEYEAAQPESEQQELMSPYDGAQELATPSNAPSPDLGDMSLHFDMDLFAQITAQMETEQDGHSNVDDDEEADVLGDLLSESQFRPRASQSQNHSQYALGESLMPSETQFNPPDPDDFEDETEMRVNGQVLNYEDQDEETLGGAFPSESQFAPRDDHYDDDSAYDDEMAEASLLPPDEQFAPSNQGDWGDDDGQQHQESTNRRPNSFSQPLFAPGASSRGESSVRDDTEVKQEGDLPYPRWLYVRTEDPEEMRQRYPGVKFLFEVKNESDVEDEGARQVVAGGEEGEWDDEEGDDNENGDEDENLEEEAALPAESQFAPIPEEEVLPTEDQFATQPDEEDDGEGVEDSPQPAEDSDEDLEDHVDPDTLLADEDWEGIGEGNQKVPAEDDVDAENPVESAENEGEAPESAAATQRASQSPSTVDPAPAPTAAAAVATASTPALGHPETRIAFNKITRRRTLEGHQFATPSPGPDDERDEEEVEQTPHSQKRVTGPRIEPSPRSQPPSQKVPSSRPTRAEEDQENRPMGAPPQPDDDEVLVEIDMNQPNGPPSPRAQAPGAEAPGAEHNGEENPLMAVQQPSQQDTVRPDPFLVDVNGRPLVTNYNMVLPADYQKRRSHLFGKIGHGPSQYVRLAGKLKWSKDDVLFLYREVQKVPMSAEHPCTVIEYLYGEYGRRSLRLRNYSAQHMKDRMRVTVMARINQLLPVHGRARHFLPNSHPDKVAYTAELAEVQGRVAAQRQAELDREGEQLGEEEEREAERDKQRKRLRERERREQEREREREEEQARRERVMEMVGRRTRKRDRTREASETDMDDTPRRRRRPAASVTPSAAIESEPEFDDFNPEVEDEPELDDEPEYDSEPEPEPEPRNERDTREDLPNVHIDDFPPPETDSETEAADAAATGARRRLSAMGLGSASRPASSSGRRVRYSEQVVVEIPTPVRATHRVAQRLSQRAAQRPAPRSTPRPSQRPAKKAISDIDGDQPRPAKRLRRVEREPEPESEHEVESERERESDREPESEREREPELEPTPESSLLPASQLSPQRSTQPSPPSQLSQSVPQSSPYRASRPFQKTFARRGGARGGGASRGRPPPAQVRSTRTASYDDEEDEDMDRARPLQAAKSTVGSIPENNADDEVGVKRERESGDERLAVPGSDLGDGATDDEAPQNHGYSQYTPANTEGDDKEVGEEGEETQAATIVRRAWLMRRVELGH
jgi:hypothetical protein